MNSQNKAERKGEEQEIAPLVDPILPDMLALGLDVVFVGAAPSLSSERVRHYYAGPTNKFWLLLHQAGFTPRQLRTEEDEEAMHYGIGLTGLFKTVSSSANHLLPPPTIQQRVSLQRKLQDFAPRFVCYNGKDVYQMATGKVCTDWGEQALELGIGLSAEAHALRNPRVFVIHSSSARADGWGRERLALYKELKQQIDAK